MKKCILSLFLLSTPIFYTGCSSLEKPSIVIDKIIKSPGAYIDTLKNPSEFPIEELPEVLNIDDMLIQNPLKDEETVKMSLLNETTLSSTHIVQVRKEAEVKLHFHKKHSKTISIKKGQGIAILNGTRYFVKPGSILQVPSRTKYKFINTGKGLFVSLSVFTPPFGGKDITYVKEEIIDKPPSEAEKEREKLQKKNLVTKKQKPKKDNTYRLPPDTSVTLPPKEHIEKKLMGNSNFFKNEPRKENSYKLPEPDFNNKDSINNFLPDQSDARPDENNDDFFTDEIDSLLNDEDVPSDTNDTNEFVFDNDIDGPENEENFTYETDDEWGYDNFELKDTKTYEYVRDDKQFEETEDGFISEDLDFEDDLNNLNKLRDENIISEDEYQKRMSYILEN